MQINRIIKKRVTLKNNLMHYRFLLVLFIFVVAAFTTHYELVILTLPFFIWWNRPNYIREKHPGQVRILTFNMFMRPNVWFIKHTESDYKNQRLEIFLRDHAQRFDVMLLQELFSTFTLRQSRVLNDTYEFNAVGGCARYLCFNRHGAFNLPFLDSGVVTVSKYPIVAQDRIVYQKGNKIDGLVPKTCLWTLLKLEERYLNVFNTHMQATHTHLDSGHMSDGIRNSQVKEMVEFVANRMDIYRYPSLVCGDFNLDSINRPPDYGYLLQQMRQSLEDIENGTFVRDLFPHHPTTFGCPGEVTFTREEDVDVPLCIDYMFFVGPQDWNISARVEEFLCKDEPFTQLSDHYGLSCTIQWS